MAPPVITRVQRILGPVTCVMCSVLWTRQSSRQTPDHSPNPEGHTEEEWKAKYDERVLAGMSDAEARRRWEPVPEIGP